MTTSCIFTVLAYNSEGTCMLEKDVDVFGGLTPDEVATGLRSNLEDCCRVIVLKDGKFAFDTNDIRH